MGIFLWEEAEQFSEAFFVKTKSSAAISNICKPAVERWKARYTEALSQCKLDEGCVLNALEDDDVIDLSNVEMSHYRLSKQRQQDLMMEKESGDYGIKGGEAAGTAKSQGQRRSSRKSDATTLVRSGKGEGIRTGGV